MAYAVAWSGAAWARFIAMAIQQHPFTSGSHWRAPAPWRQAVSIWVARLRERRRAIASVALEVFTLGGVFVAPLGALAALVALFAPAGDGVRPLAAPLIVGAAIWLALAVLCAHAHHTTVPPGGQDADDAART